MTCWQCGAPLPPDAGFCRACGAFLRPRNAPVNRPSATTPPAPQTPRGPHSDLGANPPPNSNVSGYASPPPFANRSTTSSFDGPAMVSRTPATDATPSTVRPVSPTAAWAPPSPTARPGIVSSGPVSNSTVGDVLAAAGTGFVLVSTLLTWYSVTMTPLGVQFYQSLERAFLARLFPQAAAGLGGLTGPLTLSISALDSAAGGWRWAILVVSIITLLEVLLAIGSGATRQPSPAWPHTAVLLVLTVANLVLVVAAFISLPYGGTPATYLIVTHGIGAYLGLVAAFVACGGAVARLVNGSPGTIPR